VRQQRLLRFMAFHQGPSRILAHLCPPPGAPAGGHPTSSLLLEHLAHQLAAVGLRLPLKQTLWLGAAGAPMFAGAALHAAWRRHGGAPGPLLLLSAAEALAVLLVPPAVGAALQLAQAQPQQQQSAQHRMDALSSRGLGLTPLRRLARAADAAADGAADGAELLLRALCLRAHLRPALLAALACYPLLALACGRQLLLLTFPARGGGLAAASPLEVLTAVALAALACSTEAGALQVRPPRLRPLSLPAALPPCPCLPCAPAPRGPRPRATCRAGRRAAAAGRGALHPVRRHAGARGGAAGGRGPGGRRRRRAGLCVCWGGG
jgi:hypothetical protein